MPLIGCICALDQTPKLWADCLECAQTRHPCQFTYEILKIMSMNSAQRRNAGISVTTCLGCQRQGYYALATDFYHAPARLWPATRGTAFHSMIEQHADPQGIYEHRFGLALAPGIELTGQIDKFLPAAQTVIDYKTKDKLPTTAPQDYVWQVNAYRLLLQGGYVISNNEAGLGQRLELGEIVDYEVTKLDLVMMTMQEVRRYPLELLPLDEVKEYFLTRARNIQQALTGGELPPPVTDYPAGSVLCRDWCPHFEPCLAAT